MAKKKTAKKKVKKAKKPERVEKYDPSFARRVAILVSTIPLNRTGDLAFGIIAKALGVSARTMLKWRTPGDDLFKAPFLAAIDEAEVELRKNIALVKEGVELSKINAGVVKKAQGFKKKKVTKEPVAGGPRHPPYSRFTKKDLLNYNEAFKLGARLCSSMSKGMIETAIRKQVEELQTDDLAIVRIEEEFVPSDIAAAKFAHQNMGKKEDQWREIVDVNVESESLADIIAKVGIV